MPISESDQKLLWGRAAGTCSNPSCKTDLTVILENGNGYNVGEMAHIIARKPTGPRASGQKGGDAYSNLILLCPTCHSRIDKAPGEYSEQMLLDWKAKHEASVRQKGADIKFESLLKLKGAVSRLLLENYHIWSELGPQSEVAQREPGSNMHVVWSLKKLSTIVPNNQKIINMIEANTNLVLENEYKEFLKFKTHADAFERNQYHRLDNYPKFPTTFAAAFKL